MICIKDKLPKVFANTINKKLSNNTECSYGAKDEPIEEKDLRKDLVKPDLNINQKINKIFASSTYVYKADVKIVTDDEVIIKKIIGRNNKNIITIDNKVIPIDSIKDIEIIK